MTQDDIEEMKSEILNIGADLILDKNLEKHHTTICNRIDKLNRIIEAVPADKHDSDFYQYIVNCCYQFYVFKDKSFK